MPWPLLDRLRALLTRDRTPVDHREPPSVLERLEALEAAHQALVQQVAETLEDRVDEADKLYAKVRSALGRIYRLKGWADEDAKEDAANGRPGIAEVLAAKFKR